MLPATHKWKQKGMEGMGNKLKTNVATWAILGAVLFLATPAMAAEEKITITPFTGWVFGGSTSGTKGEYRMKDTNNYGVNVDVPLKGSRTTKVRVSYTGYETTVQERIYATGVTTDKFDMRVDYYQLGGTKLLSEGKVQGYGMGTFGLTHFSPNAGYSSETLFSMTFGAGVDMMLTKHLGLNLQGRVLLPINFASGSLFCGNGGCNIGLSGGSSLLQADVTAGLVMRF